MSKTPWNNIATTIPAGANAEEIIQLANLDWKVEKRALMVHGLDSQLMTHYALVRDDNDDALGICGQAYIPLQNNIAFQFFEKFINAGSMKLETAGSVRGGRYVWALAKINDTFRLGQDDEIQPYLLLCSPHVWGKAMTIKFMTVRVTCMNTLLTALSQKYEKFNFPHVRDFDAVAMKTAEDVLKLSNTKFDDFKAQATLLSKSFFTSAEILEFASELFQGKKEVVDFSKKTLWFLETLDTQPGSEMLTSRGTWWGALNAVTYLCDHILGKDDDTRLYEAWFGRRELFKRKALSLALEYAK